MQFETEIQKQSFEAKKNLGDVIFEGMFRPYAYHKQVPTLVIEFKTGKQKRYCIDAMGYDVNMPLP